MQPARPAAGGAACRPDVPCAAQVLQPLQFAVLLNLWRPISLLVCMFTACELLSAHTCKLPAPAADPANALGLVN